MTNLLRDGVLLHMPARGPGKVLGCRFCGFRSIFRITAKWGSNVNKVRAYREFHNLYPRILDRRQGSPR